jgi:exodeoxyribonuclease VIII
MIKLKDTINVMVDLETLGVGPNSVILSIGAVKFNEKGIGSKSFYKTINIQSCLDAGMEVNGDTLSWWMEQSDAAREVFKAADGPLGAVLRDFRQWLPKGKDWVLWGNGAGFDNVILRNAYDAMGMQVPWLFWQDRCFRTVASSSPMKRVAEGVAHNALDDAITQAKHLIKICK